jgi:hypothetical protein
MARLFGACRSGRRSNLKRSLGGSAFRETLQEPCSRMRTPRCGVNWRLSIFDARATEQIQTPRESSSDLKFIAERQKLCKGESRMSPFS